MSRQLEQRMEDRNSNERKKLLLAVYGGLDSAVSQAGGNLTGLTIKFSGVDCLLVVKARFPAGPVVAFVGADDLAGCFIKATREAGSDALRWRADKYARG